MDTIEDSVQILLRATEVLRVALETETITSKLESPGDARNNRILAVVSHTDNRNGAESGSLFICKPKSVGHGDAIEIERVFPVVGDFSIIMAQMRRETLDLRSTASRPIVDQPRSGFSLAIHLGDGPEPEPLSFFTRDVQTLRSLIGECKRLKEAANSTEIANINNTRPLFEWLIPYTTRRTSPPKFSSAPEDLRVVWQPMHTRLSPASAGFPGDSDFDIQIIRDDWVHTKARHLSRKGRCNLRIRIGTFNVNGKLPSQDLSSWIRGSAPAHHEGGSVLIPPLNDITPLSLGKVARSPFDAAGTSAQSPGKARTVADSVPSKPSSLSLVSSSGTLVPEHTNHDAEPVDREPDPDMFVLGFQEVDLSTEALLYSTSSAREDAWNLAVFAALGEKAVKYEKLASKQLVGMLIVVIVKKSLKSCFGDVKTSMAGAGIMGVLGNKGGTAIRLTFSPPASSENAIKRPGPTTLTFVNSHLAAFDEMFEKRNSDYQDLSKRLGFDLEFPDDEGLATSLSTNVYESDALFWMVHLNYRLDLPDVDVRSILAAEQWEDKINALLRYDQLKKAARAKKAFEGFSEHPITHLPTYRFSPGLAMDGLGYDVKRKPAWTDRILHMSGPAAEVRQLSYTGYPLITMSDHRPVAADFSIRVDLYDTDQYKAVTLKLYQEVEGLDEFQERATISIDSTLVDLGKVSYKHRAGRTLKLHNTGKVPCAWRFVPLDLSSPINPEWLRIEPMTGLLLPNEDAVIELTTHVDNEVASRLNLGTKDLDCTLILHTVMGKDHFISVTGEYEYTCFANKLSRLIRLPGPIRSLTSPDDLLLEEKGLNVPREIMRVVKWMMSQTTNLDAFFTLPAPEDLVDTIRECLDTGDEFPLPSDPPGPEIPRAFGVTLVRLLDSLTEPVVPPSLHARCIQMESRDEAFELLDEFPPSSVNVWISLTAFLHYLGAGQADKAEKIATIFAQILLRDDPDGAYLPMSPLGKRKFLLYFIS